MAALETRVMVLSTFRPMVPNTGRRLHYRKAATLRMALLLTRTLRTGCISLRGRELRDNMVMAEGFFFPKTAEKTGNRCSTKIGTFMTSRLIREIPRFSTQRDSSHPPGDRRIAE